MKAHFNPEPEQADDESLSYDVIIGQHVMVQDQGHTFIANGRAESKAALNEEDKEADEEADDEDSEEDGSGVEDDDDNEEDDEEEGNVGPLQSHKSCQSCKIVILPKWIEIELTLPQNRY